MSIENCTNDSALILFFNDSINEFMKGINEYPGLTAACVFKQRNNFLRAIRRLHIYSGLPWVSIWLAGWKKEVRNYSNIICISSNYAYRVLRYVKKKIQMHKS